MSIVVMSRDLFSISFVKDVVGAWHSPVSHRFSDQ